VFRPAGEVDCAAVNELVAGWFEVLGRESPTVVIVDLAGVTFMDASGLGAMVRLRERLGAHGEVLVRGASPDLSRILRITSLDQVFPDAHLPASWGGARTTGEDPAGRSG
jgi:anti-anti-sigma factor